MAQDTSAYTNLIGAGWAVNGAPLIPGGGTIPLSGTYYFVDSVRGSDGNQGTFDSPLATLQQAISNCTAAVGDCIVLKAGHAETISAAGGVTVSKSGIYIIGLGTGADRPTFSFSATASTFLISAANVAIGNILGVSAVDLCVSPFSITAAGCSLGMPNLPVEYQDPSSSLQAIRAVLGDTSADKLNINLVYRGITSGGTSPVNVVRLNGTNMGVLNCDFYGRASTAMVEFVTTACTGIEIYGYMYNSGVTNYTKDVVDTAGSSTWFASFSDGAAGFDISGGSGTALGPAQAATVIADLAVASTDGTANALERDVIGSKADASVVSGTTSGSLAAYAKGILAMNTVVGADSTSNAFVGSVVGNKTDASIYVPGTTNSLAAYLKGHADLQEKVTTGTTAVMVDGNTLFTIAGGPISVQSLLSLCVTSNGATASTIVYFSVPTTGTSVAITTASASLASMIAGATVAIAGTTANILTQVALLSTTGPNITSNSAGSVILPAGTIKITVAVGSTTGTWKHFLRWKPLTTGVTVAGT